MQQNTYPGVLPLEGDAMVRAGEREAASHHRSSSIYSVHSISMVQRQVPWRDLTPLLLPRGSPHPLGQLHHGRLHPEGIEQALPGGGTSPEQSPPAGLAPPWVIAVSFPRHSHLSSLFVSLLFGCHHKSDLMIQEVTFLM